MSGSAPQFYFLAEPQVRRNFQDNYVSTALSFTIERCRGRSRGAGSVRITVFATRGFYKLRNKS